MRAVDPVVSVIVPAYNEAARIGPSLIALDTWLEGAGHRYEILVVNDGSTDSTAEVVNGIAAERPAIRLLDMPQNGGKGAVVRAGMLAARGSYRIFTDADLATPPQEIEPMLAALRQTPVAIGSRIQANGFDMRSLSQPLYRRLLGKVFTTLTRLLVVRGYADTQCGFKGFRQDAATQIFTRLATTGIVFDVEILLLAQRLNYAVTQLPVAWKDPGGSTMRVAPSKARRVWSELLSIRKRWQEAPAPLAGPVIERRARPRLATR
ncbi:MAG: dolichyl-phosphate beta-glucosyltransferase [Candidatus Xenobia bacterium]